MDDVTVCNMALSHIGKDSIQLLTEASVQAEACNTFYENSRDAALEAVDWNFARHRQSLALLVETPPDDWTFVYSYPSNCVRILRLAHVMRNPRRPYPFEVALNAAGDAKVVLSDVQDARAVYTRRITNENLFPPLFVEMFAYKLAAAIAIPLTRSPEIAESMEKMFNLKKSIAAAQTMNEGDDDDTVESEFVAARR